MRMTEPDHIRPLPESADTPIVEPVPEEYPPQEIEYDEAPSRPIDPAFVLIIFIIVSIVGLPSLATDIRYTLLWTPLAIVALLAIALNRMTVETLTVRGLTAGLVLGALIGVPFFIFGTPQLQRISQRIFVDMPDVMIFQVLVFTMPLAETLYFRGAMQATRGVLFTTLMASIWSIVLFFPALDVVKAPFVAIVIGLAFVFINFLYSYTRNRFGFFASWTCQIMMNLIILFATRYVV
jgi:hypothetical protein